MNETRAVPLASPTIAEPIETRGKTGLLSVVVPVYNEERGLTRLVDRLTSALERLNRPWEVVFVDDGSSDGTSSVLALVNAREPRCKAIVFSRNFGKEIAIAAGLRYARGDAPSIMDADLQHPPELIASSCGAGSRATTSSTASASTAAPTPPCTACPRAYSTRRFQLDERHVAARAAPATSACSTARSSTP